MTSIRHLSHNYFRINEASASHRTTTKTNKQKTAEFKGPYVGFQSLQPHLNISKGNSLSSFQLHRFNHTLCLLFYMKEKSHKQPYKHNIFLIITNTNTFYVILFHRVHKRHSLVSFTCFTKTINIISKRK